MDRLRYFLDRGQLWRCSNPALSDEDRQNLVHALMETRRWPALGVGFGCSDADALLSTWEHQSLEQMLKAL